jgi:hypothetical protein
MTVKIHINNDSAAARETSSTCYIPAISIAALVRDQKTAGAAPTELSAPRSNGQLALKELILARNESKVSEGARIFTYVLKPTLYTTWL